MNTLRRTTVRLQSLFRRGTRTERVISFLLHFIALCIFFSLPELFLSFNRKGPEPVAAMYIKPLLLVGVFYINYYVFFRLYGTRLAWIKIIAANLVLILILLCGFPDLLHLVMDSRPPMRGPERSHVDFSPVKPHVVRDMLLYFMTGAFAIAIRLALRAVEMERRHNGQLMRQRCDELNSLKSQLRPHFLFNALNSIYALIDINPTMAKDAVHRVSRLLRYVLYDTGSCVRLSQEVEFLESYASLMRIRMPSTTRLDLSLNPGAYAEAIVSPLLFINLVENAFKHGCRGGEGDFVSISLQVDPEGILRFTVGNTVAASGDAEPSGGVGLRNLRRRLELLYGSHATLHTACAEGIYTALLTINLNKDSCQLF